MNSRIDKAALSFSFIEPSFGRRLGGAIIDALLVGAPAGLLATMIFEGALVEWAGLLAVAIYHGTFTARNGQTVGKMVVGTRVVNIHTGRTPAPPTVALRVLVLFAGPIVGVAIPALSPAEAIVSVIVLLPILQPPLHRGLHDRAASTVVTAVRH